MPITLEWLIEEHLCHVVLPATLDAAALYEYDAQLVQWLDDAPGKVHVIADFRAVTSFPSLSTLVRLRHPYHAHLGFGMTLGITNNAFLRFLMTAGGQITGIKHRDFDTFEDARAYLSQVENI